jgi:hypothetical protein
MPAKAAEGEGAELVEIATESRIFVHSRKLGAKDRLKTIGERFRLPLKEGRASLSHAKMA